MEEKMLTAEELARLIDETIDGQGPDDDDSGTLGDLIAAAVFPLLSSRDKRIEELEKLLRAAIQLGGDVLNETYGGHYLGDETTADLTAWTERASRHLGLSSDVDAARPNDKEA